MHMEIWMQLEEDIKVAFLSCVFHRASPEWAATCYNNF